MLPRVALDIELIGMKECGRSERVKRIHVLNNEIVGRLFGKKREHRDRLLANADVTIPIGGHSLVPSFLKQFLPSSRF